MSTTGVRNGKGQIMTIDNGSSIVKKMYYGTNLIFDPTSIVQPAAPVDPVITANLAQWFDVTQGSAAAAVVDQSGNGRDGTNVNLTYDGTYQWWTVGPGNTDWDKYIDTNYRLTNFGTVSWTTECWVNITDVRNDDFIGMVHDRRTNIGSNFGEYLAMGGASQAKPISAMVGSDSSEITCFNSPTTYQSQWVMITATYEANYSGATDRLKLYGNAVLLDTGTSAMGNVNNATNLTLFGRYLSSAFFVGEGKFGSYRLYTVANSAADVLQNYNAEKAHYGL